MRVKPYQWKQALSIVGGPNQLTMVITNTTLVYVHVVSATIGGRTVKGLNGYHKMNINNVCNIKERYAPKTKMWTRRQPMP